MDSELKRELIANALPSVVVPILRAGVNHRYTMKQLDKREEVELQVAERKAESAREMARIKGGGATAPRAVGRTDPVTTGSGGDVYDDLAALKQETNCGFCHNVIGSLMDAPPDEARRGYDELLAYTREAERLSERGVSEEEAEEVVGELVDRWSVVPRHV